MGLIFLFLCLFLLDVCFFQINTYTYKISTLEVYNAQPIDIHKHNHGGILISIVLSNKNDSEANSTKTADKLENSLPINSTSISKNQSNGKKNQKRIYIRYNTNNSGFANNILGLVSAYVIAELLGATLVCKLLLCFHVKV